MLDDADLEPAMRERFLGVVRDETQAMSRRINELAAQSAQGLATRWPLEEMLGADFVQAALAAHRRAGQAALQRWAKPIHACGSSSTASRCCRPWPTWRCA
jgi:hypothetical protein